MLSHNLSSTVEVKWTEEIPYSKLCISFTKLCISFTKSGNNNSGGTDNTNVLYLNPLIHWGQWDLNPRPPAPQAYTSKK